MLGAMYFLGEGVGAAQDHKKAFELFNQAALQGDMLAEGMLGMMYAKGEGTVQDSKKAVEWLDKAAAQGDAGSQKDLWLDVFRR